MIICFTEPNMVSDFWYQQEINRQQSQVWWHMPLIPALGRQRQVNFWVQGQPGLQSEFQDSQDDTEKPRLKNPKQQQNKQASKK